MVGFRSPPRSRRDPPDAPDRTGPPIARPTIREDPGSWPLPRSSAVTPRADPASLGGTAESNRSGSSAQGNRIALFAAWIRPPHRRFRRQAAPVARFLRTHARTRAEYICEVRRRARGVGCPATLSRPATKPWSGLSAAPDAAEPWKAMQESPAADLASPQTSRVRNAQRGGAGNGNRAAIQAGGPGRRPRRR